MHPRKRGCHTAVQARVAASSYRLSNSPVTNRQLCICPLCQATPRVCLGQRHDAQLSQPGVLSVQVRRIHHQCQGAWVLCNCKRNVPLDIQQASGGNSNIDCCSVQRPSCLGDHKLCIPAVTPCMNQTSLGLLDSPSSSHLPWTRWCMQVSNPVSKKSLICSL
jgi:hypothetical protein